MKRVFFLGRSLFRSLFFLLSKKKLSDMNYTLSLYMLLSIDISYSSLVTADSIREEFSKQLDVAHESSCPWVWNCCPESLVQFPPSALIGGYKDRCDGLLQLYSLPIVSVSAINQMRASRGPQIDRLLALPQVYANDDPSFRMGNISATETSKEEALSNYARVRTQEYMLYILTRTSHKLLLVLIWILSFRLKSW